MLKVRRVAFILVLTKRNSFGDKGVESFFFHLSIDKTKLVWRQRGREFTFQGGTSFVDLLCFCSACVCYVFVRVYLYVLCGHLLGKG